MANIKKHLCVYVHMSHTHTPPHTPNQGEFMVVLYFSDENCERKMLLVISVSKWYKKYQAMAAIPIEAPEGTQNREEHVTSPRQLSPYQRNEFNEPRLCTYR